MHHLVASRFSIVPLLLGGLLLVGCSTKSTEMEDESSPDPEPRAPAAVDAGRRAADAASDSDSVSTAARPPEQPGASPEAPDAAPVSPYDVLFSVPSQSFRDTLQVALRTASEAAEIRYTTDGAVPSAGSARYASALTIERTTQLRAQAFVDGAPAGAVHTALYVARTFDFSSNLAVLIVDGYGGGKSSDKEVYLDAAFMLFEPVGGSAALSDTPALASRAGYHVRGQSSARFPQAPYRVELWDDADQDADHALLGMPADSDWVLIPPYYDRSLIRNPLVYELGSAMGLEAPRSRFVEVYLNTEQRALNETDYQGVYWLQETIKNSGSRTNLKQLAPEDTAPEKISGGYIFKFDQAAAEEPKLSCSGSPPISSGFGMMGTGMNPAGAGGNCWVDLEVVDPDPLAPAQAAWLTSHLQALHTTLHASRIGDYAAYIDVASFVDYLIINELTRNVDAYVRSAFYHKDRDGKIKAGPLWDYNFSLAVGGAGSIDPSGGWQFAGTRDVNGWYPKLTKDPAFMDQVRVRWAELRRGLLSDAALAQRVADLTAPLADAAARDFAKWPVASVLRAGGFVRGPTVATWPAQVDALRTFVRARAQWMDAQLE